MTGGGRTNGASRARDQRFAQFPLEGADLLRHGSRRNVLSTCRFGHRAGLRDENEAAKKRGIHKKIDFLLIDHSVEGFIQPGKQFKLL
ncbi:hypothetical protein GCM10023144_28620 [Pigmentiphaga soli]|uniref:Uncharacterized protein n=1 Tax=Pigmentiphaga soli TaxID=1007095 RepID=A0ABP8H777_9BURK